MPNPIVVGADPAPALAKGFANIADLFAPSSPRDIYYGAETQNAQAKAAAERAKSQRLADVYSRGTAAGATPQSIDLAAVAAGLYPPKDSTYAVDLGDTTKRRGQDIESGDKRYDVNSRDTTSRANNTDDNTRAVINAIMTPTPEGASVVRPPEIAAKFGVPAQSNGIVKLNQGQTATLPPGAAGPVAPLQGNPKPLTDAEAKGQIVAGLSDEEKHAIGLSDIKDRPVYGTASGTAQVDPVTGQLRNTQDKVPLPVGTAATNLAAPQTTVNVGPNGEQFGPPPKDMAWARGADGKTVMIDERGAPMAVPIGGAPLDAKAKADAEKKAMMDTQRGASSSIVTQDIDRAIAAVHADPTLTTGLGGQLTTGVGGTPARNVKGLTDSVRANVAFDRLQQMRQSSPTGGALGNVSDKEGELLQNSLGSLDQAQGPEQFVENLKRVKDISLDIIHGGKANGHPTSGPARSYEQTATNRETGARAVYRNGAWAPE